MILSKLSKKKKIILSLVTIGILTTSIAIPILVLNNDKKNNQIQEKTEEDIIPNVRKLKVNLPSSATLKGSKIKDGDYGTILQDSFGNLWALGWNAWPQVLKANEDGSGYVKTGWTNKYKKELLLRNLKINAARGTIFQDKFKNLWIMGFHSKLHVLKVNKNDNGYVKTGWSNDTSLGLTKGSKIKKGPNGQIFQDSFGNLWALAKKTKPQVLKINQDGTNYDMNKGWTDNNDPNSGDNLLKGSKITDGWDAKVFQDEFKNLWMVGNSKLQVLKAKPDKSGYVDSGWTNDNTQGLLKDSKITNHGSAGTIFQDKFFNLWVVGIVGNSNRNKKSKIQVLEVNSDGNGYVNTGWKSDVSEGLLKNSKINKDPLTDKYPTFFQDEFKNLWAIGYNTKLQVLKVNEDGDGYDLNTGWIDNNNKNSGDKLLKNSNINHFRFQNVIGRNGTIFQDFFGNLWSMVTNFRLQVLKINQSKDGYVDRGWINDNDPSSADKLLKNSKINNGNYVEGGYVNGPMGGSGQIFQDKFKNLWIIAKRFKLQVLKANKNKNVYVYVESWETS